MNNLELLLILSFVILYFIPSKHVAVKKEYLSLENSIRIKGFLAIGVALNHIIHEIKCPDLHLEFWNMFFWFVAIFFFFNGYGIMYKLVTDSNYLEGFLRKRVLKIVIPFLIVYCLTVLLKMLLGEKFTFVNILKSFFNGVPIADNLWYIELLILFYLFVWCVGKCIKNKTEMIIAGFVFVALWYVFAIWRQLSPHWMFTCLLIPVGMLFAYKEAETYELLRKNQVLLVIICGLIVAFACSKSVEYIFTTGEGTAIAIFSSVAFTILFFIMNMYIQNNGRALTFFGKISFEFYMIHGLIIEILRNKYFYINNDYIFVILVITISIIVSLAFQKCMRKLYMLMRI